MVRKILLPVFAFILAIVLTPSSVRAQGFCTYCHEEDGCSVREDNGWYYCKNVGAPGECLLLRPGCEGGPSFASLRLDGTIRNPGFPLDLLKATGPERDAVASLLRRRSQAGRTFLFACGDLAIARSYSPEAIAQIRALTKEIAL